MEKKAPMHEELPQRQVRGAAVVRAILASAIDQLARVGYSALSIEDVALGASVNKTTVYRRWPTKASLIRDALTKYFLDAAPVPQTGALHSDLVQHLQAMRDRMTSPKGRALIGVLSAEGIDSEAHRLAREIHRQSESQHVRIIADGLRRGELPAGSSARLILRLLKGAMVDLLLLDPIDTVSDTLIEDIVNIVLVGAMHGGAVPKSAVEPRSPRGATRKGAPSPRKAKLPNR